MRIVVPVLASLSLASTLWAEPVRPAATRDADGGHHAGGLSFLSRIWSGRPGGESVLLPVGRRFEFGLAGLLRPGASRGTDDTDLSTVEPTTVAKAPAGHAAGAGELPSLGSGIGYQTVGRSSAGWDFVFGGGGAAAEAAAGSQGATGYDLSRPRKRLRAGLNVRRENISTFYGFSWLGEKLEGQPDDNLVGSLQVQLKF